MTAQGRVAAGRTTTPSADKAPLPVSAEMFTWCADQCSAGDTAVSRITASTLR